MSYQLIEQLKQQGQIWSGSQYPSSQTENGIPSGYPALDSELPGNGWPTGAVTEIMYPEPHQGEVRMILPGLKWLGQKDQRWQVWLNPPGQPHGPGLLSWGIPIQQTLICSNLSLKDLSWSMDQCVQHHGCAAMLVWQDRIDSAQLRRLQLAAEKRRISIFLYRRIGRSNPLSHSRLKLRIRTSEDSSHSTVDILKRRPGWPVHNIHLHIPLYGSDWHT